MSYDILKREIKEGVVRGLYLFYGPEEYLLRHYAAEVERLAIEPSLRDISYTLFEGKPDLRAINDACFAYPLFGGKRLVAIKNSGLFKPGGGGGGSTRGGAGGSGGGRRRGGKTPPQKSGAPTMLGGSANILGGSANMVGGSANTTGAPDGLPPDDGSPLADKDFSLRTIINNLPEFTCLLIMEQEVDRRLALYSDITKKGLAVEFAYRPSSELEDWVRAIAGRDGQQFTREALRQFIENSGESMLEVRSELDKLLMYTAGRKGITAGDISMVCNFPLRARIFDFLDNLLAGRKKQAVFELETLLRDREPPMRILSTLSNHLILLGQIKSLADGGIKLPEATRLMGLNPYRAEKLWRQRSKITQQKISRAIKICHEQDLAVKSGRASDASALQMILYSIAT